MRDNDSITWDACWSVIILCSLWSASCVVSSDLERRLIDATNEARVRGATCQPYSNPDITFELTDYPPSYDLDRDRDLLSSARAHARYMARTGDYRHQTRDAIADAAGPGALSYSENIAYLSDRPEDELETQFVNGWLGSPGHCHNMMQAWSRIGASIAQADDGTWYGVQVFSR